MDKYNRVFLAVKDYCKNYPGIKQICQFEKISQKADVDPKDLDKCLDLLARSGLIKYSMEEKYIILTSQGASISNLLQKGY